MSELEAAAPAGRASNSVSGSDSNWQCELSIILYAASEKPSPSRIWPQYLQETRPRSRRPLQFSQDFGVSTMTWSTVTMSQSGNQVIQATAGQQWARHRMPLFGQIVSLVSLDWPHRSRKRRVLEDERTRMRHKLQVDSAEGRRHRGEGRWGAELLRLPP